VELGNDGIICSMPKLHFGMLCLVSSITGNPYPKWFPGVYYLWNGCSKLLKKQKMSDTMWEAIEAENLKISAKSASVKENHANIPVWGEISSGALKNLWFENVWDYAQLKITE